jgi:hypothetical protein
MCQFLHHKILLKTFFQIFHSLNLNHNILETFFPDFHTATFQTLDLILINSPEKSIDPILELGALQGPIDDLENLLHGLHDVLLHVLLVVLPAKHLRDPLSAHHTAVSILHFREQLLDRPKEIELALLHEF